MTLTRALPLTNRPSGESPARAAWGWTWAQLPQLCKLCLTLLFAASVANAQIPGAPQNVRASIEAETSTPAAGDTVTVAIVMDPKPGWHDYWLNPGDAGTPLELEWKLPRGVTAGPIRAPVPETLIVSGFMNHIYKDRHAFLIDLKVPANAAVGQRLDIKVDARWSACSDTVCIPEGGLLSVPLTVGDGDIDRARRARFDQWRAALPVPLDSEGRYAISNGKIAFAVPYPASARLDGVHFFALTHGLLDYAAPQQIWRKDNQVFIQTKVSCLAKPPAKVDAFTPPLCDNFGTVSALLRFGDDEGLTVSLARGPVTIAGNAVSALSSAADRSNPATGLTFGWILGFAVLGGLLLNLMPCVFPILGLKALSLTKMGGDEREARRDAVAYTAGVVLSCLALGGVMLALRAAGEEVGWAFQLQDPAIVMLLLLLMVAVTANLAGLFEIGGVGAGDSLTRKGGIAGSFWTGVLAAVVATPCTGPFMAAAMGGALLLPMPLALMVFGGLGLGLALPFLAIAFIPALRSRMPKPGPWMATFRKWMAVPMGLTALALLWLLAQLVGLSGWLFGGTAAFIILLRLFELGRRQKRGEPVKLVIASLLGIAIAAAMIIDTRGSEQTVTPTQGEAFSEGKLSQLRAAEKPVFLYFTADWCVTCKVNEAAAIDRAETAAAFDKAGITVMVGDYTRRDADITRFLAKHGRSGVPLYLYYPKGDEARVLPQILTVDMLTALAQ